MKSMSPRKNRRFSASVIVVFICIQYLSYPRRLHGIAYRLLRSHQDTSWSSIVFPVRSVIVVVRKEVITLVHMNKFVQLFHSYTDKINRVLYSHRRCVGINIASHVHVLSLDELEMFFPARVFFKFHKSNNNLYCIIQKRLVAFIKKYLQQILNLILIVIIVMSAELFRYSTVNF